VWIVLGALSGLSIAAYIAGDAYWHVNSVSVTFVNDTETAVILPDCPQDIDTVSAKASLVVNVSQATAYCSIDVRTDGPVPLVKCLKMPSPLENGSVVRVSDATTKTSACS